MQSTQKLYYQNSLLQEFSATVLFCKPQGEHWLIALDSTAFYPEGGGQPADYGTLQGVCVLDVQQKESIVWHTTAQPLSVGATVQGKIDWQRRLDLMQQHTGEHILSGLLHSLYGAENVGFHIGAEFVTMDTDIALSEQQLFIAEHKANQIIWQNLAVDSTFPQQEQLSQLEYRCKKEILDAVRIVTIPDADCCACCGTHLPYTGMVGQIKIIDWQNYKGGTRLTIVCGNRALKQFELRREQLALIGTMLSTPVAQTATAVEHCQNQLQKLQQQLAQTQLLWFQSIAGSVSKEKPLLLFIEQLNPAELRTLCLEICKHTTQLVLVCSGSGETGLSYAIGQQDGNVSSFVQQLNQTLQGKGGGKPNLATGKLTTTPQQLQDFWNTYLEDISL